MQSLAFKRLIPKQGWLQFTLIMVLLSLLLASNARADDSEIIKKSSAIHAVTASGTAERKVVPDEAHIDVNIGVTNAQMEAAKAEHDKKLRQVINIAEKAGIAKEKMRTNSSYTQRLYTWDGKKRAFKGYRVSTSLELTLKDISKVGELQDKLNAIGLENDKAQDWGQVVSVNYVVANADKIRDEILSEAIKNARKKANDMAAAAGTEVVGVLRLDDGSYSSRSLALNPITPMAIPAPAMALSSRAGSVAEDVSQEQTEYVTPPMGEQTISATVNVIFELK